MLRIYQMQLTPATNTRQDPYRLTWPDLTRPGLNARRHVIKTNVLFVISTQKGLKADTFYVVGLDVPGFWVIDLTSEVTISPMTLKPGTVGFVSWRPTRCLFQRGSSSIRVQTREGRSPQPPLFRRRTQNGLCRRGSNGELSAMNQVTCRIRTDIRNNWMSGQESLVQ